MGLTRRYAAIRNELRTGDIVLFAGKQFSSNSIKWVTLSPWSHVAMVLVLPEYDFVCLWEATTDTNVKCLDRGLRTRPGVQLVPLSDRLQKYDGEIALRQLDASVRKKDMQSLLALRRKLAGRSYETSKLELAASAWDGPFGEQKEDLQNLFCSELVAESYQALQLIAGKRGGKPSNEYTPADFSEKTEDLPWLRGRLGPEIMLKL